MGSHAQSPPHPGPIRHLTRPPRANSRVPTAPCRSSLPRSLPLPSPPMHATSTQPPPPIFAPPPPGLHPAPPPPPNPPPLSYQPLNNSQEVVEAVGEHQLGRGVARDDGSHGRVARQAHNAGRQPGGAAGQGRESARLQGLDMSGGWVGRGGRNGGSGKGGEARGEADWHGAAEWAAALRMWGCAGVVSGTMCVCREVSGMGIGDLGSWEGGREMRWRQR